MLLIQIYDFLIVVENIARTIQLFAFHTDNGIAWSVYLVFNNSKFSYLLTLASVIAVVVSCFVIVLAVVIVALVGYCFISVPLSKLSKQMNSVASLKLKSTLKSVSCFYEFQDINTSLNLMNNGLSNFAKYVPIGQVANILESNKVVELGVTQRNMTILFIDMKNFTTMTEQVSPTVLVDILHVFYDTAFVCIEEQHGVVDKYIGDCVMAFWNAPMVVDRHASKAIRAALNIQERLPKRSASLADNIRIETRIGINTGIVLVGNIGAKERMNYTVLGDVVNIASRLEAECGHYDRDILIGEDCLSSVISNDYLCCWTDFVSLHGKKHPIHAYSILGFESCASDEQKLLCKMYSDIKTHLEGKNIEQVLQLCRSILKLKATEKPAQLLMDRLIKLPLNLERCATKRSA